MLHRAKAVCAWEFPFLDFSSIPKQKSQSAHRPQDRTHCAWQYALFRTRNQLLRTRRPPIGTIASANISRLSFEYAVARTKFTGILRGLHQNVAVESLMEGSQAKHRLCAPDNRPANIAASGCSESHREGNPMWLWRDASPPVQPPQLLPVPRLLSRARWNFISLTHSLG